MHSELRGRSTSMEDHFVAVTGIQMRMGIVLSWKVLYDEKITHGSGVYCGKDY